MGDQHYDYDYGIDYDYEYNYDPSDARNLASSPADALDIVGSNSTNGTDHNGEYHHAHAYYEDSLFAPFALLLFGAILRHSTR